MDVFDRYAKKYDAWYDKHKDVFEKEVECLKNTIGSFKIAVEIGVGSGRFAEALGVNYGIDISKPMLKLAAERGVEVIRADGKLTPFKDSTFDLVLLAFTICFVDDPEKVLKEASRILKREGKLVICGVLADSKLARDYRKKKSPFYISAKFYTFEELKRMLKSAGMEVLSVNFIDIKYGKDVFCLSATFN